ncbi:MAG: ATP-binding protein [Rikenellaceae bacterium]
MLLVQTSVWANGFYFRRFDSGLSLSNNVTRNMIELPNGSMAILNANMVTIFNGTSSTNYHYDLNIIPFTEFSGMKNMYYDSRDILWFKNRDNTWALDLNKSEFIYDLESLVAPLGINRKVDNIFIPGRDKYFIYTQKERLISFFDDQNKSKAETALPAIMGNPIEIVQVGDNYWVLSDTGIVAQWDTKTKGFTFIEKKLFESQSGYNHFQMIGDLSGRLWIIRDNDLICYDTKNYEIVPSPHLEIEEGRSFLPIAVDENNILWVGAFGGGIARLDIEANQIETFETLELVDGTIANLKSGISQIYIDSNNGIWVVTEDHGLLYHHKGIFRIEAINNLTLSSGKFKDKNVKCMLSESDGTMLVGTTNGLYRYDPRDKSITIPYPELSDALCIGLFRDSDNRVWVGTFYRGAYCIDDDKIDHYQDPQMPPVDISYLQSTPNTNCVRTFFQNANGDICGCVYGGIGILNAETKKIDLFPNKFESRYFIIRGVARFSDNKHVAYGDNGILVYDSQTQEIDNEYLKFSQRNNNCHDIKIDSRGIAWIATLDGLVIYDTKTQKHRVLDNKSGLAANKILSVNFDSQERVWASTSSGISVIALSPKDDMDDVFILNLGEKEGLFTTKFYHTSSEVNANGDIYFGSTDGFFVVDPSILDSNRRQDKQMVLDGTISTKESARSNQTSITELPELLLDDKHKIKLDYNKSTVTFNFRDISYVNTSLTKFRYRLKGYDPQWIESQASQTHSVSYSMLPVGRYTFEIQCANNTLRWGRRTIEVEVVVNPPWWTTAWMICLYILAAVLLIFAIVDYILKRRYAEHLRLQEAKDQQRKRELEEMKQQFFINVSHELRTPLSLILMPLESMLKREDEQDKEQLQSMHRNAKQLKQLVDNLLDFRRVEKHGEAINPTLGDMKELVLLAYDSFKGAADNGNLNFTLECDGDTKMMMLFDYGMIQKVVNNLLSNAFKYTPDRGRVTLSLHEIVSDNGERLLELKVSDTGRGIPQKDVSMIFDHFYQASNSLRDKGSGIGLSLVKSYVEMHGGSISVETLLGEGSTFTVHVPIIGGSGECPQLTTIESEEDEEQNVDTESNAADDQEDREYYKVLIIEDNRDFRDYLSRELSEYFHITLADNGVSGVAQVNKSTPDLIICDVMMPEMDGYEFTEFMKSNIETSHIPIILLTAQSSQESRLKGYETGADAFISKPFHWGVLHARINNLIDERRGRITKFNNSRQSEVDTLATSVLDKKFIQDAIASIERNLDNAEYSVEIMSKDLAMNRMGVYRKLKSIVDQAPSDFIRTIRLKRAAQWLEEGNGRGQSLLYIANMFGFSTTKYFAKHFKEMFGETPVQYLKRFSKR